MDRFFGFVKQIRRSRRRKGKKYRPEEDYHEGYEDVYYYASEHLHNGPWGGLKPLPFCPRTLQVPSWLVFYGLQVGQEAKLVA
ncbi:hypothetical protein AMELA_G00181560 [Ameiurus melas]|uniref:Uncharacterized protein n=1 Tax=Ameiurus melas TaxID=219545 RepID=A0A7J6AE13_AMEME|nr:hypothetical protein AMELA_G00181560 [Ameiurus melas]